MARLAVVLMNLGGPDSPEAVEPNGRYATLAQAIEQFKAARSRSIEFAELHADDLYPRTWKHPRYGPLNGVEMLILVAGHARRHGAQIREVRETLGQS